MRKAVKAVKRMTVILDCCLCLFCLWGNVTFSYASDGAPDYQIEDQKNEAGLTEEEKAYVSGMSELVVGCTVNVDPVSYLDEETGEVAGITREILELVAGKTGLRFQYKALPSGSVTYQDLLDAGIDLIAGVEYNGVNDGAKGISLTKPYLDARKVVVCRRDTLFHSESDMKVAVISGSQTVETVIHEKYPDFEILFYSRVEDALDALVSGEVDGVIQNQYCIDRLLHKPKYEGLRVVATANIGDSQSLSPMIFQSGGEKNEKLSDPLLISVLNKGISALSDEEVSLIIINETTVRGYELTSSDILYQYRYMILVGAMALISIGFLTVYAVRMKMRSQNMEILEREERKHQILIEKTEQLMYEIDLEKREIRASGMFLKKFGWVPSISYETGDMDEMLRIWHVYPEDSSVFEDAWRSAREGQDSHMEIRLQTAEGTCRWCRIAQFVLGEPSGKQREIIGLIQDVDQEITEKQKLTEETRRDALTGLYNKEVFNQELEKCLDSCSVGECAVIFLDMDNFKCVNDRLGHMMGDRAIRDVSQLLKEEFPDPDVASRFGGDEFCILVRNTTREELQPRIERLGKRINLVYEEGDSKVSVTVSIGVAMSGFRGCGAEKLLSHADTALYRSKKSGKNCITFYQDGD